MRDFETQGRTAVEIGQTVQYLVTPMYKGNNLVLCGVIIEATGSGGFNLFVTVLNRK